MQAQVSEEKLGDLPETQNQFRDFDLKMMLNVATRDVVTKKDVNAIKQALKNLILSNVFDRKFNPAFGGNIYKELFEPMDQITVGIMETRLNNVIKAFEKRIINSKVKVIPIYGQTATDQNKVRIVITYALPRVDRELQTEFTIERLR